MTFGLVQIIVLLLEINNFSQLTGEGIPYGGLPFPHIANIQLVWKVSSMDYCFYVYSPLGIFFARGFYLYSELYMLPSASFIPNSQANLWMVVKRVSGLADDSPCGVWYPGWTTCLLYGDLLLSLRFKW